MNQVDFYLLASSELRNRTLFACRLANKATRQRMPVYIRTSNDKHSVEVDKRLWTFMQNSFVPHTIYAGNKLDRERFPVQIGCVDNPHLSDGLLILLTEQVDEKNVICRRIAEIVLNDETHKAAARIRYGYYRNAGLQPKTHVIN